MINNNKGKFNSTWHGFYTLENIGMYDKDKITTQICTKTHFCVTWTQTGVKTAQICSTRTTCGTNH